MTCDRPAVYSSTVARTKEAQRAKTAAGLLRWLLWHLVLMEHTQINARSDGDAILLCSVATSCLYTKSF